MTLHKLTAGDGYTYLTRQVASHDQHRTAGQSLADYYVAHGNPPGVWLGKGAQQLGVAGDQVSEAQMKALFGEGVHPDAGSLRAAGKPESKVRLGQRYPSYADLAPYADRVAGRINDFTELNGRPPTEAERNQLAATEAKRGRRAVAGFDLVFSPVKSASVLWALGGPEVRALVEAAHHEAVASAIEWLEEHAAYSRTGHGGVAQIEATGLVCAAFDHRESRSGDPDLHTHVAVANKVCGKDGKWRSLDARGLYAAGVAASERYNTRLEDALTRRLGVDFVERPGGTPDLRPVREINRIPSELLRHFSRRRQAIDTRYAELRREYGETHGREPDNATRLALAQQATLETREGKGVGRSLAEQVDDWMAQARDVVGEHRLRELVRQATGGSITPTELSEEDVARIGRRIVSTVAEQRSTWTVWNLHAEAERQMRPLRFRSPADREDATRRVVAWATSPQASIRIAGPELVREHARLVRDRDEVSVFVPHGSVRYTSSDILLAEDRLIASATNTSGPRIDDLVVDAALAIHQAGTGITLDPGQQDLVRAFASSPAQLAVGIGPAGTGKTTAMRAFAHVWSTGMDSGRVIPLATSSKAAHVLGEALDLRAENLHKFLYENNHGCGDPWFRLGKGDVVLVDEAGMAGTLHLAELIKLAAEAGAAVRLLGDPAQLAAVDAGGALRLLESEAGATFLTDLHRFTDLAEGEATLALRRGDRAALRFYFDRDRVRSGPRDSMLESAYDGWSRDVRAGKTSVLVAATTADVAALNARARLDRVARGDVEPDGVILRDGNQAGVGDWVTSRTNSRLLRYGRGRWVHNGDLWRVTHRHIDGSLTVRPLEGRGSIRLPSDYVDSSLELAYASTAHRVQGATTDTAHALVTPEMTREVLYVAATRGRSNTVLYAATESESDLTCDHEPDSPKTVREILESVLTRTSSEDSATSTIRHTLAEASSLPTLISRYDHARSVAAIDALHLSLQVLPGTERERLLNDKAMPHLARTLASAASRGAEPSTLLRVAYESEPLADVRSPALVLASRIEDLSRAHTSDCRSAGPLPWLPTPDVGHRGWAAYLQERADLIRRRADELGSLPAAYREAYGVSDEDPLSLGDPPEPGTRRELAYRAAMAAPAPEPQPRPAPAPAPVPSRSRSAQGPRLTR